MEERKHTVKRIDFNSGKFDANGKTYYIDVSTPLAVGRFGNYEALVNHSTYGTDWYSINEAFKKIYNALTGNDGYGMNIMKACNDSANMALNMSANIVKRTEQKYHSALLLCTLFLNTSEEDIKRWDMPLAAEKIKDWEAEGLATEDFFSLAMSLIPGFRENYSEPWTQTLIDHAEVQEAARMEADEIKSSTMK